MEFLDGSKIEANEGIPEENQVNIQVVSCSQLYGEHIVRILRVKRDEKYCFF